MKVEIIEPRLLVVQYRQEESDPDYGTCLWLRCTLNLDAHSISIESDCGNYAYGGFCTPNFLKFCGHLGHDQGYLLGKMSKRTIINDEETIQNLRELFAESLEDMPEENGSDEYGDDVQTFWGEIEDAVSSYSTSSDIVDSVRDVLMNNDLTLDCDEYDLYECIVYDYTANAKKAIEVFCEHIVPVLAEKSKEEARGQEGRG